MFNKIEVCEKMSHFIVRYSQDKVTNDFWNNFEWDKKNSPEILQEMIIFTTYCMGYSFWRLANNPFVDDDVVDIMKEVIHPISIGLHSINSGWTSLNNSDEIEKLILENMPEIKKTFTQLMENYLERKEEYDENDPMSDPMGTALFSLTLHRKLTFLIFDDWKPKGESFTKIVANYPQLVIDDVAEFLMENILPLHKNY